jgi:hypothetical protein
MCAPKLHHYVPRFHLARFTNERGQVCTFDKVAGKVFAAGPMALAAERQFYTLPEFTGTDVDPLFLEKQFAQLEGEACNITRCWLRQLDRLPVAEGSSEKEQVDSPAGLKSALQAAPKIEIPDVNRQIMSDFIALQFFRTADARELLKLVAEVSGIYKEGVSDYEARSLHAMTLCKLADGDGIVSEFAQRVRQSIWMLARNSSQVPFHTSDTPVLLKTRDNRKWLKGPGIFQEETYVVYAITPALVLYCKERSYWKALEPFDCCISPVKISGDMAKHENSGHAGLSARFVFSSRDDFDDAKAFIADPGNFPPLEELLS